jgi:hypothetical protein
LSAEQTTWFEDFASVGEAEDFAGNKGYRFDYCTRCFRAK